MEVEPLFVILIWFGSYIIAIVICSIPPIVVMILKNILICDNFLKARRSKISYITYWNLTAQYYSLMLNEESKSMICTILGTKVSQEKDP